MGQAQAVQTHTVAGGETLSDIANRYYGSAGKWRQIAQANGIADPGSLRVGQQLRIPDAPAGGAARSGAGRRPTVPAGASTHVVASNDSLWVIAEQHYGRGDQWRLIKEANPGINPNQLLVGQRLIIPPTSQPSTGRARTTSRQAPNASSSSSSSISAIPLPPLSN